MKMNRKFWAVILSAVLVMTLVPFTSYADEGEEPYPVSAALAGNIDGYPGGEEILGLFDAGNDVQVTFSDGSLKHYLAGKHKFYEGTETEIEVTGFFLDGADPEDDLSLVTIPDMSYNKPLVIGDNNVKITVIVPYKDEKGDVVSKALECVDYNMKVSVTKPVKVEFKPAEGFTAQGVIGFNCIQEDTFYGEGNAFDVTFETTDGDTPIQYTWTYKYVNTVDENGEPVVGFFENGDPKYSRFELSPDGYYFDLEKGLHEVELVYYEYPVWQEEPFEVPFKVNIDAEKYEVYAEWQTCNYTGKNIKPKFVLRRTYDEKKISATEYTVKYPSSCKKMGYYEATVTFKDAYKDKYSEPVTYAYYGIGPTKPTIKRVRGGKKQLTVTWKKFTAKQLKSIDGMKVMVSTDKNFYGSVKSYTVSKKDIKKYKKVISKLKAKKKYYVRMFTYKKNVKQSGYTFTMQSDDSNVKYAKTK